MASGLLLLNYHFAGDIIAGGFVGAIVGTFTIHCIGFEEEDTPSNRRT